MYGYTKVEVGDRKLSNILKKYGWTGQFTQRGEITNFFHKKSILAIVKYKDMPPKEVWLKNELIGRGEQ